MRNIGLGIIFGAAGAGITTAGMSLFTKIDFITGLLTIGAGSLAGGLAVALLINLINNRPEKHNPAQPGSDNKTCQHLDIRV